MSWTHGTSYAYRTKRCRCEECLAWLKGESARRLAQHREAGRPEHGSRQEFKHGTGFAYRSRRCRCEVCRAWNAARNKEQRRLNAIIKVLDLPAPGRPTEDEET